MGETTVANGTLGDPVAGTSGSSRLRQSFWLAVALSALTGVIALSYEILWYRAFAFVAWGAPSAFGLLLGFYLLGIAGGAFVAKRFCKSSATGASAELIPLGIFLMLASVVGFLVIPALAFLAGTELPWSGTPDWPGQGRSAWPLTFLLVQLSAALFGAVLPLTAHFGIAPDDRAGARLSYVYLANILGSTFGSAFTGLILMDLYSTKTISTALLAIGIAISTACFAFSAGRRGARQAEAPSHVTRHARLFVLVALALAIAVFLGRDTVFRDIYARLLYKEKWNGTERLLHELENRHGVIVVNAHDQMFGGSYDGAINVSFKEDTNMIERAYALYAIHPSPKRVLIVGLATGSWAQVIAHLPGVEMIDVVEINPGYLELIEKFEPVRSILKNPKVHIHIDDGRRWMRRHPEARYDAIVMNTSFFWRAHATALLSVEFLALARAHLLPGGIHLFNSTGSDDAQKTAATFFPYALRIVNCVAVSDTPIHFDRERFARALTDTHIDGGPSALTEASDPFAWRKLMQLAASEETGIGPNGDTFYMLEPRDRLLERTKGAGTITEDNMLSEWRRSAWEFPEGFH